MKIFYQTTLAIIIPALAIADNRPITRGLHRGGGRGGRNSGGHGDRHGGMNGGRHGGRPFTQEMIEEKCAAFECEDIAENIDCNIERPERLDFSSMTEEQKQEAKSNMEEIKEDRRQQILSCACCTNATIEELLPRQEGGWKGQHHGQGHHGGRGFVKEMIETECDAFPCDGIDENIDCNIEKRPDRLDFSSMTEEQKQEAKSKMEDAKEERRQQILSCACCTNATIEELLPRQEGGWKGHHHGQGHHGGRGYVKEMIETECDAFPCDGIDENIDCNIEKRPDRLDFSSMTEEQKQEAKSKMEDAKEERRQQILSCACCTDTAIEDMLGRDDVVSGLEDSNEDDVSVLLASLLMDESEIEVKESYLSSSACRGGLSSMLAFAVVGVISIVV